MNKISLDYNNTLVDLSKCKSFLENINLSDFLYITKLEYDESMFPTNNQTKAKGNLVTYYLTDTKTGEDIELKNYCGNEPILIKFPIPQNTNIYSNKETIFTFQEKGINLLDNKNEFYTDRCFLLKNSNGLTLKERMMHYFNNETANCSPGCKYLGLDSFSRIICQCDNSTTEISISINTAFILSVSTLNYDVIMCFKQVIEQVKFCLVRVIYLIWDLL